MRRGFRVYDKQEKRMIDTPAEVGIYLSGNGNLVNIDRIDFFLMDRYVRMDSTGQKDKEGKEIFEGDIFKQKGMEDELIVGEVIFDEGYHGFMVREGQHIFHWLKFAGEVIGNVMENPELIKEGK